MAEADKKTRDELMDVLLKVLESAPAGDIETYRKHTAEDLSCFEWYVHPYRIDGYDFHLNLIEANGKSPVKAKRRFDILSPRFQVYGDTAIVTYNLLATTSVESENSFHSFNETRVFVRADGGWKMVHFHKSPASDTKI